MKKSKTESQQKQDYEKVYEYPLEWCPLFGSLPEIKNTHLENDNEAYIVADKCLGIIESARPLFGIYDNYMVEYVRLPEIEKLPISIYHEYGEVCKAVRRLFKNLDYLTLKTSDRLFHIEYYNLFNKNINDLQCGPIRDSNRYTHALAIFVQDIDVLQAVQPKLLYAAKQIIDKAFELDEVHLYALYAILEAWLILTSLLFHSKRSKDTNDFYLFKAFYKAEKLLQVAESCNESKQKQDLYVDVSILNNEIKNRKEAPGRGGKHEKTPGIRVAMKEVIKITGTTIAKDLLGYFEKNHEGKKNGMRCDYNDDQYLIYYDPDESGEHLVQLNITNQTIRTNDFKSFQYNLTKIKKELKKPE